MTKTEFKALKKAEMQEILLDLFEDPEGSIADANLRQLQQFTEDNWEYIDSVINAPEEEEDAEVEASQEEEQIEKEEDEDEEEVLETTVNLQTDLYSGSPPT